MGLDTTHDCWHGAYSGFAAWRQILAEADGRTTYHPQKDYEWCNYQGMWYDDPDDILDVLLIHSDCDGFLFPRHLGPLSVRLEELMPKIPEDWQEKTQEFIDGLRSACNRESDGGYYGYDVVQFR